MPPPSFPSLSRKINPGKTRGTTLDPTLRDTYENGMESARARFLRPRRQWDIAMDMLTPLDVDKLTSFVNNVAVFGANDFLFTDTRRRANNVYHVRFSTLPSYSDAGNVEGEFRQNCTFQIREV